MENHLMNMGQNVSPRSRTVALIRTGADSHQQTTRFARQRVAAPSSAIPVSSDDSLYRRGVRLLYGIGMERDSRRAVQCFREAYARGDLNAGYMLADCLTRGDGTARDFDESFQIASHLVDKSFYPAYYLMADAYMSGKGTAMDPDKGELCNDVALKHCSASLSEVDESIRFEALLGSMGNEKEVDWYAVEKVAQKYREISDWLPRYSWLALALLRISDGSALAKQETLEIIEASLRRYELLRRRLAKQETLEIIETGCAENDVLCFLLKAYVEVFQEHYEEAKETLKRGLEIKSRHPLLCDLMWTIAAHLNENLDKVKQAFWEACAMGVSAIGRGNDLGVKIEIEAPFYAGSWVVYREDIAEEKLEKNESIYLDEPIIIVKNTNDEKLEGTTIRLCSADVKLDKTFHLKRIPPHGEISLETSDLGDIQYGEKLYIRVSKGDRYSEMDLEETLRGLDDFRPPLMPLMLTWKSGILGGCFLRLKCLEGTLSNIIITKQSGATARIPSLEATQKPASAGWREFSDGSCLTPFENFVVQCDGYAPITGIIKPS